MIHWIHSLCSHPTARVKTNGCLSESFPIQTGMRQPCPLFPTLFLLSFVPFICKVKLADSFYEVKGKDKEYHLSAFWRWPAKMILNRLYPLSCRTFTYLALYNLKINYDKTPPTLLSQLTASAPFKRSGGSIKYLSIHIQSDSANL